MSFFTSSDFNRLRKDLRIFVLDTELNLDELAYAGNVMNAAEFLEEEVMETDRIEFQWPHRSEKVVIMWHWLEDWNKKRLAQNASRCAGNPEITFQAEAQVNAEDEDPEQSSGPERLRPLKNPMVDFHLQLLQSLLNDRHVMANRILILRDALRVVEAGANVKLVEWHVKDIKKQLPDDEEILEAADLLFECIKFIDVA